MTLELEDPTGVHAHTTQTSQQILLSAPAPGTSRLKVTIDHPDYVTQVVTVRLGTAPFYWDNRNCELVTSPNRTDLTITMGRVRQAPVVAEPFGGKAAGDQSGVFYQGAKEYVILRSLLRSATTGVGLVYDVRTLKEAAAPGGGPSSTLTIAKNDGWDRFSTADSTITLASNGGYLWLEYGSVTGKRPKEPRFLIAVWAPAITSPVPQEGLDCIVYFSPSTATADFPRSAYPYRVNYPYTVFPKDTKKQPYIDIAYRHLIFNHGYALALTASKKPALIVMPIFPAVPDGKESSRQMWQPFNSQEGLHRLLLEITQFLHGFGYAHNSGFSRWQGASAPEGGLPALPIPPAFSSTNQPRPKIRNVTLAGFSSGISGLFPVISTAAIQDSSKYPAAFFAADAKLFNDIWRELWDLDFELKEMATGIRRAALEKALLTWLGAGRERRLRMHHSGHTTGDVRPATLFPEIAKLAKTVTAPAAAGDSWAEEWRDLSGRWSLAFYSVAYLLAKDRPRDLQPVIPKLTDLEARKAVHPFTAAIGFGHAAQLRLG
ncbi:hypothetical protein [Micromonospora kangleipakensis]|uniref:hypothetical protein n=1 Tax=Micromonospora kangleipakensis TaxID=1077942 RepID=UPI001029843D|nr:hypothetical protein [Micromonospora kangleipakensis]